jgi:hypothetical protein
LIQLPKTEETLWMHLLGRDETQTEAIAELLAFPEPNSRRDRVLQLLVNWRINVELTGNIDLRTEERELMAQLSQAYLEWEQKTKQEGRQEGRQEEARSLILRQLTRRVGELSPSISQTIDGLLITQLEALGEALLEFSSLSDLETWLARQARDDRS